MLLRDCGVAENRQFFWWCLLAGRRRFVVSVVTLHTVSIDGPNAPPYQLLLLFNGAAHDVSARPAVQLAVNGIE